MTSTPQKPDRTQPSVFVPDDQLIAHNIVDEEFPPAHAGTPLLMAYLQDAHIYVVEIDPTTGHPLPVTQVEVTQQEPAATFLRSAYQGPEWGYSDDGLSLFFAVMVNDKVQIAYSKRSAAGDWSAPVVLTGGVPGPFGRMGQTPSEQGPSTQVNYTRWDPAAAQHPDEQKDRITDRHFYWMDVKEKIEHKVEGLVILHTVGPHFLAPRPGSPYGDLLFTAKDEQGAEQVVRYNTDPGVPADERVRFLTGLDTDQGNSWNHWDPNDISAPEYDRPVYAVNVVEPGETSPRKIAIYQASATGDPFGKLELLHTLEIPSRALEEGYASITSVEPVVTKKATFLVLRLVKYDRVNPLDCTSSIWLWSLDGKLQRRVSGEHRLEGNRQGKDPEGVIGAEKLLVYYSVYNPGLGLQEKQADLRLCGTGVYADGSYTPGPNGE